MFEWWNGLTTLNQVCYAAAAFFSVIFLWQFISSLIGLAGGEADFDGAEGDVDADGGVEVDVDDIEAHSAADAADSTVAFRILSVRAILAFCMLFSWAAALYLDAGKEETQAIVLAVFWGLAAWAVVAILIHWLRKLAETGTRKLSTAVGREGTVYLEIPSGGTGEVRVRVSGVISVVKARGEGGEHVRSGTPVRVVGVVGGNTVKVRPLEAGPGHKETGQ